MIAPSQTTSELHHPTGAPNSPHQIINKNSLPVIFVSEKSLVKTFWIQLGLRTNCHAPLPNWAHLAPPNHHNGAPALQWRQPWQGRHRTWERLLKVKLPCNNGRNAERNVCVFEYASVVLKLFMQTSNSIMYKCKHITVLSNEQENMWCRSFRLLEGEGGWVLRCYWTVM